MKRSRRDDVDAPAELARHNIIDMRPAIRRLAALLREAHAQSDQIANRWHADAPLSVHVAAGYTAGRVDGLTEALRAVHLDAAARADALTEDVERAFGG